AVPSSRAVTSISLVRPSTRPIHPSACDALPADSTRSEGRQHRAHGHPEKRQLAAGGGVLPAGGGLLAAPSTSRNCRPTIWPSASSRTHTARAGRAAASPTVT